MRAGVGEKPTWRSVIAWLSSAAAFVIIPIPAAFVEAAYSTRIYTILQPAITSLSNTVSFALFDVLIAGVVAVLVSMGVRDMRAGKARGARRALKRALICGSALYIAFVVFWGLNYRRRPITDRVAFDAAAVTPDGASRLASIARDRLNSLHTAAHAAQSTGAIDPALAHAFATVVSDLSHGGRVTVGRPKRSALLDWYFQRAGVSGMTDPFFLETMIAGDLLAFERPFVVAHEWSHLAGLNDEGEANLGGWLTCVRSSPAHQYSGWLFMYDEVLRGLPPEQRAAVAGRLDEGPRADLRAVHERILRHVNVHIATAGWRAYDTYLKANRVEAGAASYDDVVRLALGIRIARAAGDAESTR